MNPARPPAPPPAMCWVEITNVCNFRCSFCAYPYMRRPRTFMGPELFRRAVDMLVEGGLERGSGVGLHALGEPLLHPRLLEYIDYMNGRGLAADLYTNGALLTPDLIDELARRNLIRLAISIQAPGPAAFAQAHPGSSLDYATYRERCRAAVGRYLELAGAGRPLGIRRLDVLYMTTFRSQPHMEGLQSWEAVEATIEEWQALARGCAAQAAARPRAIWEADHLLRFELARTPGACLAVGVREAGSWAGSLHRGLVEPVECGTCSFPSEQLLVLAGGEVTVCCQDYDGELAIGKIQESSLAELWSGAAAERLRASMRRGRLPARLCRLCQGFAGRHAGRTPAGEFHAVERWGESGPRFQWMGRHARRIAAVDDDGRLELELLTIAPCSAADPQVVTVAAGGRAQARLLLDAPNLWREFRIGLPEQLRGRFVLLELATDRAAVPGGGDERELGLAVALPRR